MGKFCISSIYHMTGCLLLLLGEQCPLYLKINPTDCLMVEATPDSRTCMLHRTIPHSLNVQFPVQDGDPPTHPPH